MACKKSAGVYQRILEDRVRWGKAEKFSHFFLEISKITGSTIRCGLGKLQRTRGAVQRVVEFGEIQGF
jgi:hypothetical protein